MIIFREYLGKSFVKSVAAALVMFCGIAGGIWFGSSLWIKGNVQAESVNLTPPQESIEEIYVSFEAGDLFPLENFTDSKGTVRNFEDLLGHGVSTLLLFSDLECSPCLDLLRQLKKISPERLNEECRIVLCLAVDRSSVPEEFTGLVEDYEIITYDTDYWWNKYRMGFSPTVIGVDGSGFVTHIQLGFDGYLDYELSSYFFTKQA